MGGSGRVDEGIRTVGTAFIVIYDAGSVANSQDTSKGGRCFETSAVSGG